MISIPYRPALALTYAELVEKLAPYSPTSVAESGPNAFTITTARPVPDDVRDWVSDHKPAETLILFEVTPPGQNPAF